ncbi:MAG TPA: alpha/beta hydrolase [Beijerinckiaceae bacterium]|jgi:pimeloyl-ACP methyl ester carboxylesterase
MEMGILAEAPGLDRREFALPSGRISALFAPGRRSTVLLVHGNSSCKEVFARQFGPLVSSGFGVLAADLPGHGGSANAGEPKAVYSFPGYAAVLSSLLDELALDDVQVLGWSLGGHVGLELWGTDPRVRSLLITGTPPIRPSPEALRDAFTDSPGMDLAGKRDFTAADALTYATLMLGGPEHVSDRLLGAVRRTDGDARFWMVRNGLAGTGVDQARLVRSGPKPLAVVQGARDPFLNLQYLHALSYRRLWRDGVQLIETAGHAPHWQAPAVFNALMLGFLEWADGRGHQNWTPESISVGMSAPG